MNLVKRDMPIFGFDKNHQPVLTVDPGQEVTFETFDPLCNEVQNVEQLLEYWAADKPRGPLSGPVFVNGAQTGDTLLIDILKIELSLPGFQLIGPNRAIITDEIPDWTFYQVFPKDHHFTLPNGIELPVDPVIGTFGNAPSGEPTSLANRIGGNYDVPAVKVGSRLYLPIEVPGALFSLGDVHACQGDGEVVGAPEIAAQVTVRLTLLGREHSEWFMIEDKNDWHTACPGTTESEALKKAVFHNAKFISRTYGVELKDALILLTMIGHLSVSRTGIWGSHAPIVCSSFSKELVKTATVKYQRLRKE